MKKEFVYTLIVLLFLVSAILFGIYLKSQEGQVMVNETTTTTPRQTTTITTTTATTTLTDTTELTDA